MIECLECRRFRKRIAELEAPRKPMDPERAAAAMAEIGEQVAAYYRDLAMENLELRGALNSG